MNAVALTDAEKVQLLLSELQDAGEELQRWRGGDNRALRTVREMQGQSDEDDPP